RIRGPGDRTQATRSRSTSAAVDWMVEGRQSRSLGRLSEGAVHGLCTRCARGIPRGPWRLPRPGLRLVLVELRLLGPLELVDDEGRAVGLPGGKPRTLLALLGLEAGRVVSVDGIQDVLWGERPPATAGRVVENYVSRLRKLFPEGVLERRGPGWVLR